MKLRKIIISLYLAASFGAVASRAATVWTGPLITYTQPAPDPSQPANQDRLTPNVWLTRGLASGIFNGLTEPGYAHNISPADTQWAVGSLADYATLVYTSWEAAGGGRPVMTLPGQQLVVHLISEDIYLSVKFTELGGGVAGGGNGFSYERSTPAAANIPPSVSIDSPTNGASFTAPANVPITASAQDPDGSVTNVSFFDGATFLGASAASPYTITSSLAIGSHALTAVATDNLGLSTTSSIVNVTVSSGNFPPSITITNPVENAVLSSSAALTIRASASDSDGTVTNVQFFDGLVLLGSDSTLPYSLNATLAPGVHTLTAVARDNLGAATTSAPVHITMGRYLPAITNGDIAILLQPIATGMAAPD